MRQVIANKVKSALCNPDAVDAERKAMFDDTYSYAKRSVHPESHPPDQRVKAYKRPTLDKKLHEKVQEVKEYDARLMLKREEKRLAGEKSGLLTAQLGSVYDIPLSMQQSVDVTAQSTSTAPQSTLNPSASQRNFMPSGSMSGSMTGGKYLDRPMSRAGAGFSRRNHKLEGRSNYFSYVPDPSKANIAERKLERVWFYHKNKELADKRANEEAAAFIKERGGARGRMESEI